MRGVRSSEKLGRGAPVIRRPNAWPERRSTARASGTHPCAIPFNSCLLGPSYVPGPVLGPGNAETGQSSQNGKSFQLRKEGIQVSLGHTDSSKCGACPR